MTNIRKNRMILLSIIGIILLVAGLPIFKAISEQIPSLLQVPSKASPKSQQFSLLPPLSEHAKLHTEAIYVHNWLSTHDVSGCKWDCGARTRYNCKDENGNWLFAVVEGMTTITAFFTDQSYGVEHTRDDPGCSNPFHPVHP